MTWAEEEFGETDLGDLRRTDRLVQIASKIVSSPESSLPSALCSEADNKACYRFMQNESFDFCDIILGPLENCWNKIKETPRAILVQDTSLLNYDSKKCTLGLGQIGSKNDKSFQGIVMHWTLALTPLGEPLGIADLQLWTREKNPRKISLSAHQKKPIEEKESMKWIQAVESIYDNVGDCDPVWVTDREGDVYEHINTVISRGYNFVVRCNNDRIIGEEEGLLKERIRSAPILSRQKLEINVNKKKLELSVNIQVCECELIAGRKINSYEGCKDHHISVVRVSDDDGYFEWILLTSLDINSVEEALEVISIYKNRWKIEEIHKTLKSGFRAEQLTLNSSFKLQKAIALLLPCAIEVYRMLQKQKREPENLASSVLTKTNIKILCKLNKRKSDYIPTYKEAWLWIGYLGGFRGSKNSAPPGQITFWRGWRKLMDMTKGAELLES